MGLMDNVQMASMSGAPAQGGGAATTGLDPSQSTLSPNFASYVYNMLGRAEGLANLPYQQFTGQRFAGASPLQQQAFSGLAGLSPSTTGQVGVDAAQTALSGLRSLTPTTLGSVESYMNPYVQNVVDIQAREARRQADISRQAEQARLAQAGAYGGSRQAIMEAERQRNLGQQIGDIQERGMQSAYDRAMQQRQQEGQLGIQGLQSQLTGAQTLGGLGQQQFNQGLQGLQAQLDAGGQQRQIEQQPLDFGYQQFQESMRHPYQQTTYMQSMLQGIPLTSRPYESGQSSMSAMLGGGLSGLALWQALFGGGE